MDLANLLSAPRYTESYKRSAPPSPPVEDQVKFSLPSISTLLEGADGAQHAAKRQRLSPCQDRDVRYDSVHLPPTPPMRPGSGSGHSVRSPSELTHKPSHHVHRSSISSTSSAAPISRAGPYASPAPSVSSYSSPIDAPQNIYYPRPPTTTTFQPATTVTAPPMPQQQSRQHSQPPAPQVQIPQHQHHHHQPSQSSPSLISPVTPAWQHHHYFPPSTATPYQQNHDRYICRTCHKAFSRPSSLRIHSHSHTGEKPFRCTVPGCGKAFSVRSNMKRHERGCHSARVGTVVQVPAAAPTALVS
ncbi:uncharacterized protein N7483_004250 [Penicillium malachiteum]|uniref:uncharacterized protein n=1 Tax=Penicillium malachiteum TaxID=1324776 RepID=UPI002547B0D2|nr:uncharacterized protein N7483_004250 [Penicillium malachiteum]KAJ5729742.1 hypothetical protein N7483_004250 [Penicillium malachiteum]